MTTTTPRPRLPGDPAALASAQSSSAASRKRRLQAAFAVGALGTLLFASGCITPTVGSGAYYRMQTYTPERSQAHIDSMAKLQVSYTLSPEVRAKWKNWMNSDQNIDNYREAMIRVVAEDVVQSGIFTRVEPNPPNPDFIIQLDVQELMKPTAKLVIREQTFNSTKQLISDHTQEAPLGMTLKTYNLKTVLPQVMAAIRADLLRDVLAYIHRRMEERAAAEAAALEKMSLPDLLVSSDRSVTIARARNRALIAAKDRQLPEILRKSKTDELTALVVRIEQTILDLNHNSELAKDRAQQTAAANGNSRQVEDLREMSICYRERIELLKPIAAAIREEIANRNR